MDLPPAPTPPVNNGNMAPNSDRTANLLNLLKFSTTGGANPPPQLQKQQQQQQQPQHSPSQSQSQQQQNSNQSLPPQQQQQHVDVEDQQLRQQHLQLQQQFQPQHQSYQYHSQAQDQQQLQIQQMQQHQQQVQLQHQQNQWPTRIHQPAPASADPTGLLAALMRGAQEVEEPRPVPAPLPPAPAANSFAAGSPSADTQSYLLSLLNRPKPSQTEQPAMLAESARSNDPTPQSPEMPDNSRFYGGYQHSNEYHHMPQPYQQTMHQHQPLEQQSQRSSYVDVQHPQSNVESFSYASTAQSAQSSADISALYQQVMGSLPQASPQSHAAHPPSTGPPFQILKKDHGSPAGSHHTDQGHPGSGRSPLTSPPAPVRRLVDRTSSLQSHHSHQSYHSHHSSHPSLKHSSPAAEYDDYAPADKHTEAVAEAVSEIAEKVDHDAREALERAEQSQIKHEISAADQEVLAAAHVVEKQIYDLKKDMEDEADFDAADQILVKEIEESVQSIVDEVQGVADSWESADQDQEADTIVVIEEKDPPPVKVYNFPMKPWISISLQDDDGAHRPQFREESIMDIARLKKEFDQMDRNLYTASQNYMTYGMSKQGGLRVIRQDDGKDAKVFTDTKDRIFNIAMSVTPSDYEGVHKESIIGTGVSGTVYWVEIKDGDKDHIEDTHLEQYGFALPPVSSQEGDAPGGVLKTRARASTAHPEYFAVGRGKSINLIWPSYILRNNLFKAGHDRVVDTEALFQQCSLKINTGKAGKDFTFSQDDTVVVSLDKSGRIKFWDVRDLTAVKEGSDPRSPQPAQLSLEVKEPLLTLASTPEGEKAWPTSVLLLDKQRPYQKRCALRYMIVGMKQNHTLQLWDLALGKPVQEFNLPHSKESDAVCSVMYHPATGMIVIGHPTRNSVYFAHLSAPKYNLKSVTQAEYIQRLVAQDASIPQPDSTAVISGVREYSFASKGVLRSLDILCNPAMAQDSDEPTLFELYAMHSKGVACMLVRQGELGWSKDNKVLEPVDAVAEGIVAVSKLKSPQPVELPAAGDNPPVRIANRGAPKETLQATPVQSEAAQRGPESVTPVKLKNEPKEAETPINSSKENLPEKPERKSRKKKGGAAAAAAQADAATNGSHAPAHKTEGKGPNNHHGISSENLEAAIANVESRLSASMSEQFKSALKTLHNKIDEGGRVRDENFNQHQLKLLDMVSEVLNENTQKVLEALIHHQFTELVIPAIGDKAGKAVTDLLNNKLQPNIADAVHKEIQGSLPHALNRSLRSSDFVSNMADRVSASVAPTVQNEVLSSLTQRITPMITNMATQTIQGVSNELRQQYHEQMELLKAQHAADTAKIDQLMSYVTSLTEMVTTMAASQSSLQAEFLKFKTQPVHELPGISGAQGPQPNVYNPTHQQGYSNLNNNPPSHHGSFAAPQPPTHGQPHVGSPQYMRASQQYMASPQGSTHQSDHGIGHAGGHHKQMSKGEAEAELELVQRIRVIEQAIQEGRLQDAIIQWIQSNNREEEIFRRCLSRLPPSKFENLPPLMLLVVIATISKDLRPNARLKEEIEWIEMAVRAFGDNVPRIDWDAHGYREVMKSTLQTLQLLISRVRPLINGIQDGFPTDPFLMKLERGKLEWIVRSSEQILDSFGNPRLYD